MSNIGWHRLRPQPTIAQPVKKMEYIEPIKITEDMPIGQKEFARRYNTMRKKIMEHGLMEDK